MVQSLFGWDALLISGQLGLPVMAAAFFGLLLFDWHASQKVQEPTWYPKMRCLLTAPVITSFTPRSRMLLIQIEAPTIFQKILVLLVEGVLFYATARTQRGNDPFLYKVRLRYGC